MSNAGLFSAAMLTMVKSVKTLTKSVTVPLLDNQNRTQAGQGTWKCGLPAEFLDGDQTRIDVFEKNATHQRDNVVYWKTNGKINNDLQCN